MTLRKRGVEPQGEHRRLDGHITPEDPPESLRRGIAEAERGHASELPWATEGAEPDDDATGGGRPAAPAGDWEG